jgi:hypothetical protein
MRDKRAERPARQTQTFAPIPAVNSKVIRESRKRMRCSRAVFARPAADSCENAGEAGAEAGQAESAGGGAGAAGA